MVPKTSVAFLFVYLTNFLKIELIINLRFIRFRCENIENKAQTYELLVFLPVPKSLTLYCCKKPEASISFLGAFKIHHSLNCTTKFTIFWLQNVK